MMRGEDFLLLLASLSRFLSLQALLFFKNQIKEEDQSETFQFLHSFF